MKLRAFWTLLLVSLLALLNAQAQTPPPSASTPATSIELPPCWPANIGGKGTAIVSGDTGKATWFGWWCPLTDGSWSRHGFVSSYGYVLRHPTVLTGTPADWAAAYWRANVGQVSTVALFQAQDAMANTMQLYRPANGSASAPPPLEPTVWVVAPDAVGSTKPQPTFAQPLVLQNNRVSSLSLNTPPAKAIVVGETCDCNFFKFLAGASVYCAVASQPSIAAVCQPKLTP